MINILRTFHCTINILLSQLLYLLCNIIIYILLCNIIKWEFDYSLTTDRLISSSKDKALFGTNSFRWYTIQMSRYIRRADTSQKSSSGDGLGCRSDSDYTQLLKSNYYTEVQSLVDIARSRRHGHTAASLVLCYVSGGLPPSRKYRPRVFH